MSQSHIDELELSLIHAYIYMYIQREREGGEIGERRGTDK